MQKDRLEMAEAIFNHEFTPAKAGREIQVRKGVAWINSVPDGQLSFHLVSVPAVKELC